MSVSVKHAITSTLKGLTQKAAYRAGIPAVVGTVRYDWEGALGSLDIFFGHHVVADGDACGELQAGQLYDRLMYLRRTRELVSLSEGLDWLQRPRRGSRLAAITFDDGYRDNLTLLLPVLEAAHAPATVFVATGPVVDGGSMWFDLARCALRRAGTKPLGLAWAPAPLQAQQPAAYADKVMAYLQRCDPLVREKRVGELLRKAPAADPPVEPRHAVLTAQELQALARHPLISIGAHTHSHTVLDACDEATARGELRENLQCLARLVGAPARSFAYPRGLPQDFSQRDQELLRDLGIEVAVTTRPGPNVPGTDPLALNRLPLGTGGVERFAWTVDVRPVARHAGSVLT